MASSSIHRQESHPTLPPAKLQKLERLSLYYNLPAAAIICTKCGFALTSPTTFSRSPTFRASDRDAVPQQPVEHFPLKTPNLYQLNPNFQL
jgi:hypothetical protein